MVTSLGAADNVTEQSNPIYPVLQTHTPKINKHYLLMEHLYKDRTANLRF